MPAIIALIAKILSVAKEQGEKNEAEYGVHSSGGLPTQLLSSVSSLLGDSGSNRGNSGSKVPYSHASFIRGR